MRADPVSAASRLSNTVSTPSPTGLSLFPVQSGIREPTVAVASPAATPSSPPAGLGMPAMCCQRSRYGGGAGWVPACSPGTSTRRTELPSACGTVWVNTWNVFDVTLSFGGHKEFRLGPGNGPPRRSTNYLETKTVITELAC